MTTRKKNIYIIIFSILLGVILIGGTYAALTGLTVTNAAYSGTTACFDIEYDITNDDGSSPITGTLFPSSNPQGGLSGKVTMSIADDCDTEGIGTINLNVVNATKTLLQKVDEHCEDKTTLKTLTSYTTASACNKTNTKWVTDGTALKYAVYTDIYKEPISTGYVNKNGTIAIYDDFELTHTPTEYYIYIWLDGEISDNSYANASFNGTVTATVAQVTPSVIEKPVLDGGMIPVTIDNDGTVKTVLSTDSSWYDYDNQEWANVVLVKENETDGLVFDGVDDGVELKNVSISSMDAFSFEVDFKLDNIPSTSSTVYSIFTNTESGGFGIDVTYNNMYWGVYDAGVSTYVTVNTTNVEANKRYLVTGIYNNGTISLYINGQFIGSTNTTGSLKDPVNGESIYLGCNPIDDACGGYYLDGTIYSARFYEKALTEEEITSNYNKNIVKTDLLFNYDFSADRRAVYRSNGDINILEDEILAYYTWIPRYKYKMPTKCSSIPEADRNMEDYPECYAPYTMSDTDKANLIAYYEGEDQCDGSAEAISEATALVEYALETGRLNDGYAWYYGTSIVSWVEAYNNGEINDCGVIGEEITLIPSSFNENATFTETPVEIDIAFESASSPMSNGDAINTYRTHPAFWWDDDGDGKVDNGETIAGIWVGKFETSADPSSTCYSSASAANCDIATISTRILPNVSSIRYQRISTQVAIAQLLNSSDNIYGLSNTNTNAHMMKNSEWGAVAYLSHSKYGANTEIRINNNSNYTTGCGASDTSISPSTACNIPYNSTSTPQSTTGNITGIFDMSGGTWESVSGNYGGMVGDSGFTTITANNYYDIYSSNQFTSDNNSNILLCTLDTCGGHALLETKAWYNGVSNFITSNSPWFIRGGVYYYGTSAGIFTSSACSGEASNGATWRSVIIVEKESSVYTVSYDANGGTGSPSSQTKTYGQTLTLSSTMPTRED